MLASFYFLLIKSIIMSAKKNILFGISVGLALGILFAPRKGAKTRKKIAKRGSELREGWNNLKDKFHHKTSSGDTFDALDDFTKEESEAHYL